MQVLYETIKSRATLRSFLPVSLRLLSLSSWHWSMGTCLGTCRLDGIRHASESHTLSHGSRQSITEFRAIDCRRRVHKRSLKATFFAAFVLWTNTVMLFHCVPAETPLLFVVYVSLVLARGRDWSEWIRWGVRSFSEGISILHSQGVQDGGHQSKSDKCRQYTRMN